MDQNELENMLSNQESIEDNDFSTQVMLMVPQEQNEYRRSIVLILSTMIGSLLSFFILSKSSSSLLREMFQGLATYHVSGLAMVFGIVCLYLSIFQMTKEQI